MKLTKIKNQKRTTTNQPRDITKKLQQRKEKNSQLK